MVTSRKNDITGTSYKVMSVEPIDVYMIQGDGYDEIHNTDECVHILYTREGKYTIASSKSQVDLLKGDMVLIPPSCLYRIKSCKDARFSIVKCVFMHVYLLEKVKLIKNEYEYESSFINQFIDANTIIQPKLSMECYNGIGQIINDMLDEENEKKHGYGIILLLELLKLLVLTGREVMRSQNQKTSKDNPVMIKNREAIMNSIRFIDENYNTGITLEKISRYAMMSRSYFSCMFREITGTTFIEYINDLRIRKAMEMLSSRRTNVNDICYDVGFQSIFHFNRMFKREVGVSPTVYRKIALGEGCKSAYFPDMSKN